MTGLSCNKTKTAPQRSCAVCRKRADQSELVRLVCDEKGFLKLQEGKKIDGRGAYLHLNKSCLAKIGNLRVWQNVFKRSDIDKSSIDVIVAKLERKAG